MVFGILLLIPHRCWSWMWRLLVYPRVTGKGLTNGDRARQLICAKQKLKITQCSKGKQDTQIPKHLIFVGFIWVLDSFWEWIMYVCSWSGSWPTLPGVGPFILVGKWQDVEPLPNILSFAPLSAAKKDQWSKWTDVFLAVECWNEFLDAYHATKQKKHTLTKKRRGLVL